MTEQEVGRLITKAVIDPDTRRRLFGPRKRAALLKLYDLDPDEIRALMGIQATNFQEFAQACLENGLVKDPFLFNPQRIPPTVPKPSPRQK